MNKDITLYSYRRCPFAIRVRLTLHEKELSFRTIEENLKEMSEAIKRLHPEAKVPLLLDGDIIVYESSIITEYLDDQYPIHPLMPKDAKSRMCVREWTYWCNQIFKPQIDIVKYGTDRLAQIEVEVASEKLQECLSRIDQALINSDWLVGESMSLADIHLFPFYRQIQRMNPPYPWIQKYPRTAEWYSRIIQRPSFEKTMCKD